MLSWNVTPKSWYLRLVAQNLVPSNYTLTDSLIFVEHFFYHQLDQLAPKTNKQIFLAGRATAVRKWNLSRKRFVAPAWHTHLALAYPPSTTPPINSESMLPGAFFPSKDSGATNQRAKEQWSKPSKPLHTFRHTGYYRVVRSNGLIIIPDYKWAV